MSFFDPDQTDKMKSPQIRHGRFLSCIFLTAAFLVVITAGGLAQRLPPVAPVTLRAAAEKKGIKIGATVDDWILNRPEIVDLLVRQFDTAAIENSLKFLQISTGRGTYDFTRADRLVDFLIGKGLAVQGHVLVWHVDNPKWLDEVTLTKTEAEALLKDHIFAVAGHFRGRIASWDVVNEAFEENGSLRETVWLRTIGPDYIEKAFRWAREADPGAVLFYNDYRIEEENPKSDAVLKLMKDLKSKGVRVDAVGFQSHLDVEKPLNPQLVRKNIGRFFRAGFPVMITELDLQVLKPGDAKQRKQEAVVAADFLKAVLAGGKVKNITFWGLTDENSWIPSWFPNALPGLPFAADMKPKPLFDAVLKTIEKSALSADGP